MSPSGFSIFQACSRMLRCLCCKDLISASRLKKGISGCLATMPEAEHGASSKILSKGRPSHQDDFEASPRSTCTLSECKRRRSKLPLILPRRSPSSSSASISQFANSNKCAVLPPGAAHASKIRSPGWGFKRIAAN